MGSQASILWCLILIQFGVIMLFCMMPVEMMIRKWILDRDFMKDEQKRATRCIQEIEWLKQKAIANASIGTCDFTGWYQKELNRLMRGSADAEIAKAYLDMETARDFLEISVIGDLERLKEQELLKISSETQVLVARRINDLIERVRYIKSKLETPRSTTAEIVSTHVLEEEPDEPSQPKEV